jgi:hypothetical protein
MVKLWANDESHLTDKEEIYPAGTFGIVNKAAFLQATIDNKSDDIFTHDFKTTAEISYLGVPLIVKGGIMRTKYWVFARLGITGQVSINENLTWQIDGKDLTPGSPRMPDMIVRPTATHYLVGGETGVKFGKNGFFLLGDLFYGTKSFAYGLPGTAVMQAAEFFIGYRRFI